MKQGKWFPKYADEINKLAEEHLEALLALAVDAYDDGVKVGRRNALFGVAIGVGFVAISLSAAVITYLERKQKIIASEES